MPNQLAERALESITQADCHVDLDAPRAAMSPADEDALVRSHLPLVGHLVREVLNRVPSHVSRDDLVSAGMFALASAVKAFDPAQGVAFGAYASIRIRGALADELRSRDWASRSVRGKARELDRVRNDLAVTLHRAPDREEVAHAMGVTAREVENIEGDVARAATVSLQALTSEDSDTLLPSGGEQPEELLVRREQIGLLHDAVAELPERMQTVVRGYFFEQRRLLDIAEELGVTESRVSQMRAEALTMLRGAVAAPESTPAAPTDLGARARSKQAARASYVAAVAGRSSLSQRLAATTTLGEPIAVNR